MTTTYMHPIVLFDDLAHFEDYREPLEKVLRAVQVWWELHGYYIGMGGIKIPRVDHGLDLTAANPHAAVTTLVYDHNLVSLGEIEREEHKFLVLLRGWDNPQYAGWGGGRLSLVGELALRALLTTGSPDAIMDDSMASGLIAHEVGHTLGFAHSLAGIMSWGWVNFPNVELAQGSFVGRLMSVMEPVPCPIPESVTGIGKGSRKGVNDYDPQSPY